MRAEAQPDLSAAVTAALDARREEMIEFLRRLVRTPSLAGQEQAAQAILLDAYRAAGLETTVIESRREDLEGHPAFCDDGVPFDQRLNVVGRWNGRGGGRSLILNGHIDVVPVGDPRTWSLDPWSGEIINGKLYGRGACDMKSGLVAALFAVLALRDTGFTPGGDVLLQSVIGEESGGIGTLTTIVHGLRADGCIIMESTGLDVVPVHSGALTFRITVAGRAAHACLKPEGVSALEEFIPILRMLDRLEEERHARYTHPLFDDPRNIAPIVVGTVRAGDWPSTVPGKLVAEGRFGVFPGESVEEARHEFTEALAAEAARHPWLATNPPKLEWFEGQFDPGETPVTDPIVRLIQESHRAVTGREAPTRGLTAGTDLRLFTRYAGIPTVMYGPGEISLAHVSNEYVALESVVTSARALAHAIVEWTSRS